VGGYASSGCAGALPLGRHELKTNTSMKSSQFFQNLSTSLLLAMETKGGGWQGREGGGSEAGRGGTHRWERMKSGPAGCRAFPSAAEVAAAVPARQPIMLLNTRTPACTRPWQISHSSRPCPLAPPASQAEPAQELSPTSVVNFPFEEEIETAEEIARGELACATD